jgi:hypothetical protein
MRKLMIVLLCVGVLVSWQLWQGDIVSAGKNWGQSRGKAFKCSPAGMWRMKMDAEPPSDNETFNTVVPLDPTGKRFAVTSEIIKWNVTLGVAFPAAVHITNPGGIMVKVSRDTYEFTSYAVATDAAGVMVYEMVISGVIMLVDCDLAVSVSAFEIFPADVPPFYGEPFCGGTATVKMERLKLVPPCIDLPPFPDFDE